MKIIIADDHELVRKGFEMLLNYQPNIEVVGTAADGQTAYRLVSELHPDIVLLDISMPPGESGMVTVSHIHADFPETKIIMLTMYDDREYLLYTIQNGASGFVLKNAPEQDLLDAINTVHQGGVHICKDMIPHLVESFLHRHAEEGDTYLQLTKKRWKSLPSLPGGTAIRILPISFSFL